MSELLEKLRKDGADIEGAMDRFLGDTELYETCFSLFLQDEAFGKLGEALAEKDDQKAFEYAHTLKGVTGNMGLTPLYQAICSMVEDLRQKEHSHLAEYYKDILLQLKKLQKLVS
ncbi:MAG: Hpt domain-containing protein [Oscillospiraceae bacterium]